MLLVLFTANKKKTQLNKSTIIVSFIKSIKIYVKRGDHFAHYMRRPCLKCINIFQHWYAVCLDESLWKRHVIGHFDIPLHRPLPSGKVSWRSEYERIIDRSPIVLKETLEGHTDEIYHVCFSGTFIATTGKDASVRVSIRKTVKLFNDSVISS